MIREECNPSITVEFAYTPEGHFILDPMWAHRLARWGIKPELANHSNKVTSYSLR